VIHGDIKLENILLQNGHAMVADFGIALAVQTAGGARMTQTGLSLGTPQYMSPEQAMGDRALDARSDIYALGAVTYEMLTGEPPFSGATVQAIVAKVLTEKPIAPSAVRDTVTPGIEATVLKALSKLPADRWPTTTPFAEALTRAGVAERHGGMARLAHARIRTGVVCVHATHRCVRRGDKPQHLTRRRVVRVREPRAWHGGHLLAARGRSQSHAGRWRLDGR